MMGDTSDKITSATACELLRVDRSTLVRWVKVGRLQPAFKFPGKNGAYLFQRSTVEALAERRAS